jgi:transposase
MQRRWKRGADAQAIGRSRGGRTTKIHAVADRLGRLIGFDISPGQLGDCRAAPGLVAGLPAAKHLLADTAYDSDSFRQILLDRSITPVIKPNPMRKNVPPFNENLYKRRNLIERAFCHLKDWRRVATRYDKLARNFHATITLATLVIWWSIESGA